MTGLEVVAAAIGTMGGVAFGIRSSRNRRQAMSRRVVPGGQELHVDVLRGQQRRCVVAALELLAECGTIDGAARCRALLYQDIASSVDSRHERIEAHRQLLTLWIEAAALAKAGTEATTAQATRVDRQLAALQADIDKLDESTDDRPLAPPAQKGRRPV